MALRLYFDAMSQPSRSVLLFLKCNAIPFVPKVTDIVKGQNRSDAFRQLSPSGKVPAIDDNGFCLIESVAILKYLCNTRKVSDHWYPSDPQHRAKIDEYLAWHHSNLRFSAAMIFQKQVLLPMMLGKEPDPADKYYDLFDKSADMIEKYFLKDTPYIHSHEISIADLMALCEFSQLEVMATGSPKISSKIQSYIQRCKDATQPHYDDVHAIAEKLKKKLASLNSPNSRL